MKEIIFPTELHRQATAVITDYFQQQKNIDSILLVNSIARGKSSPESDIDMAVLVSAGTGKDRLEILENEWNVFLNKEALLARYKNTHRFAQIHLDIIDGNFMHTIWEPGAISDHFEIEIGNRLVYAAPLSQEGDYFIHLKKQYLPYYDEVLRSQRLQMVKEAFTYDIEHIASLLKRELYFHAFEVLSRAFQKFIQLLFIENRVYPIAYNKWIKEQVEDILKLPALYKRLPNILSVTDIESNELNSKAKLLTGLLNEYC